MIRATILKDVRLLLRDRGALASMFVLPVVFIGMFGLMFSGGEGNGDGGARKKEAVPIAVWAPPGNARAARFRQDLEQSADFRVTIVATPEAVDAAVVAKDASAGVLIPPDLDPEHERPAVVVIDQALPDADRLAVEMPLKGSLIGSYYLHRFGAPLGLQSSEYRREDGKIVATRSPAGLKKRRGYVDSFQITVPGNAVLFCFFLCVAVALSFVEERKLGTWRRLLAAPISRRLMLVAKLVPFWVIGMIQMLFLFAVGVLAFGMNLSGSVAALFLVTAALVTCAIGLGFLVASFGGSEKQVGSITTIVVLVMGLLGGCMFPRFFMPPGMQKAGLFIPHGWALDAYRDVIVREGTTMGDVLGPALVLLGFGALFTLAGSLRFRFER